ncbi:hypothetical protein CBR_g12594 [Chara braunii]|uniref:Uncharacterized protein n=1 Tax=Chara braunii TaxID=69332 RepID=A0A388KS39_CHABU|nr:hypothetical protein CBR_g12594 [Chara braunii]|eukprot:GBG72874.1 hypothetical protein CBR_g12594 [Chara braunii]
MDHSVWGGEAAASTISEPIIQLQQDYSCRRVTRSLAREVGGSLSPHPRPFGSENLAAGSARTYSGNPISPAAARRKYQQKSVTSTPSRSCSWGGGFDERPVFSCPSSPYDGRDRGGADRDPEEVQQGGGGSGGCSQQDRALTPESVDLMPFSLAGTRSDRARRAARTAARGCMVGAGGGGGRKDDSFSSSPLRVCRSISFDWTNDRVLADNSDEEMYSARPCGGVIKELGVVRSEAVSPPSSACKTRQQRRQHRRAPSCGGDFEIAGAEPAAHWPDHGRADFLGGLRSADSFSRSSMYRQRQSSFSGVRSSAPLFTPAAGDVVGPACSTPSRSDNPGYGGHSFIDWLKDPPSSSAHADPAHVLPSSTDGVAGAGVPFSGFFTSKRRLRLDDGDQTSTGPEKGLRKGEIGDGRHGFGGWWSRGGMEQSRLREDEDGEEDNQMGASTMSPSTDFAGYRKHQKQKGGRKIEHLASMWRGWTENRRCYYSIADVEATSWLGFVLAALPVRRGLQVDRRALHLCLIALIAVVLGVIIGPGSMPRLPNLEIVGSHRSCSSMAGDANVEPPKDTGNGLMAMSPIPSAGDGTASSLMIAAKLEASQSSIQWWEKDDAVEIRRMWFEQQSSLPDPFAETPVTFLYSSALVKGDRKVEETESKWEDDSEHGHGEDNEFNSAHGHLDDVQLVYSVDMADDATNGPDYKLVDAVRDDPLWTDRSVAEVESQSQLQSSQSQSQYVLFEERSRSHDYHDDRYLLSNNDDDEGGAYMLSSASTTPSSSMLDIVRPAKDADQLLSSSAEDDDIVLVPSSSVIEQELSATSSPRRHERGRAYGSDSSAGEVVISPAKLAAMQTPEASSVTEDGVVVNGGDDEDNGTIVGVIELDADDWESSAAFAAAARYDYDAAGVVKWEEEAFYPTVEEEEMGGVWSSSAFVRKLDAGEIDRLGLRPPSASVSALSDEYLLVSEEEMIVDHEEDEFVDWVSIWTVDGLGVRDDATRSGSGSGVPSSPDGFGSAHAFGGDQGEEETDGIPRPSGDERGALIGRRHRDPDSDLAQTYPGLWGDVATWTLTASLSLVLLIWGIANGSTETKLMKLVMTEEEEERRRSRGHGHPKEKERSSITADSAVSTGNRCSDQLDGGGVMTKEIAMVAVGRREREYPAGESSVTLSSNLPTSTEHSSASSDDINMMNTGEVTSPCSFFREKKKSSFFSKQESGAEAFSGKAVLKACGMNSVSASFIGGQ